MALTELCEAYWYPLYAYVRRRGRSADDASDLVQGFLARLIEKGELSKADETRGRFRGFLLANMRFYEANQRRQAEADVRGGGQALLSIDTLGADGRYLAEPIDRETPEFMFERAWTRTLLERAQERLKAQYEERGQGARYEALKGHLVGDSEEAFDKADVARTLGISEGAFAVALHRIRKHYAEALRSEVGATVSNEEDVDEEIRALLQAASGS
jgi:RNA polymerase sigma-70 factor (ECF subfamily)